MNSARLERARRSCPFSLPAKWLPILASGRHSQSLRIHGDEVSVMAQRFEDVIGVRGSELDAEIHGGLRAIPLRCDGGVKGRQLLL
jgi:hypothetical protein